MFDIAQTLVDVKMDAFTSALNEERRIEDIRRKRELHTKLFNKKISQRVNVYKNANEALFNDDQKIVIKQMGRGKENPGCNYSAPMKVQNVKRKLAAKAIGHHNAEMNGNYEDPRLIKETNCKTLLLKIVYEKNQNLKTHNEYKKRISETRKIFLEIEREKAKQYLTKFKQNGKILRLRDSKENIRCIEEFEYDQDAKEITEKHLDINESDVSRSLHCGPLKTIRVTNKNNNCKIPILCCCHKYIKSDEFDTRQCASNCVFYKNPKSKIF